MARRGVNLFHRYMLTAIEKDEGENYVIRGHLMDSFHEMSTALRLDRDFVIRSTQGDMFRCPDPICQEALQKLDGLAQYRTFSGRELTKNIEFK